VISDTCEEAMRDIRYYSATYPRVYTPHAQRISAALEALEALHSALYAASAGRFAEDAAGLPHAQLDL